MDGGCSSASSTRLARRIMPSSRASSARIWASTSLEPARVESRCGSSGSSSRSSALWNSAPTAIIREPMPRPSNTSVSIVSSGTVCSRRLTREARAYPGGTLRRRCPACGGCGVAASARLLWCAAAASAASVRYRRPGGRLACAAAWHRAPWCPSCAAAPRRRRQSALRGRRRGLTQDSPKAASRHAGAGRSHSR